MWRRSLRALCPSTNSSGGSAKPVKKLQVAIVGGGPSGCYVAHHLLKASDRIHVDVYEKLPVPYGLSRYGVAPDHPEVKNVEDTFTKMFESKRATFLGNIHVGKEVTINQLLTTYSAVCVATGADNDVKLNIPGEDLHNVLSARQFVNYYNTLPAPYGSPAICPFPIDKVKNVVIIGNGNVALDCARTLATYYKHWCPTDMNMHAVHSLMKSKLENVHVVARRGVEHSAFTTKEFRELTKLEHVHVLADRFNLEHQLDLLDPKDRAKRRQLQLVHEYCASDDRTPHVHEGSYDFPMPNKLGSIMGHLPSSPSPMTRNVFFRYNLKPVRFLPRKDDTGSVGSVMFKIQHPSPVGTTDGEEVDPSGLTPKSPDSVVIPADVVLRSVGYRVDGIPGIPFDHTANLIPNLKGRVEGVPRLFCSGWAKRGPKGVIVQTMMDAQETARSILSDIETESGEAPEGTSNRGKFDLVAGMAEREVYPVMLSAVKRIWNQEREKGIDLGKKAEKVPTCRTMLDMAMGGRHGEKAANHLRGFAPSRPPGMELLEEWMDDDTRLIDANPGKRIESGEMEFKKEPAAYRKLR